MKEYTNCAEVRENFSALLDDELSSEEQAAMESHLDDCAECARELDVMKQVEFTRSADASRPVSYRPVAIAAITLALLATVSYLITQGMGSPKNAEVPEETPQSDAALEALIPGESEEAFWGTERRGGEIPKPPPQPDFDRDSPENKKRLETLKEMHRKAAEDGRDKPQMKSVKIRLGNSGDGAPTNERRVKEAEELRSQYTIDEDGLWTQKGYTDQPITLLKPFTKEYNNLLFRRPYLPNLVRHTRDLIFSYEGKWYRVAHEGILIKDPLLGDPYPNARKRTIDLEAEAEAQSEAQAKD